MSVVNTVFVKGGSVYLCSLHKNRLVKLLKKECKDLPDLLGRIKHKRVNNDGYLLVDFDDKILFSNQTALEVASIDNERIQKEWNIIENV